MSYNINDQGFYGPFGGTYVPDMLRPNIETLQKEYLRVIEEPGFREEFDALMRDYVGRPSPLYFSQKLSDKYGARIYLKRKTSIIPAPTR